MLKRSAKRPRFDPADRGLWVLLSRCWPEWAQALELMQADTVRRWRRQGIWHYLRWRRGRKRSGRPPIPLETRNLIREMSRDNRLWGAPRLHGELAKLGIKVSRTTVATYMNRRSSPPSPTWRTFIRNQAPDILLAGMTHGIFTVTVKTYSGHCPHPSVGGHAGHSNSPKSIMPFLILNAN